MNRFRTSQTALALALSAGLVFAAGTALADDTRAQNTDRLAKADSDQPVNDTWITTKVKSSLLADSDVAGMDIRVVTNNGVVGLSGNVESQAQADRAKQIAQDIEGVSRVDDSGLTVGSTDANRGSDENARDNTRDRN
ncbi:BON domain-containing protein [Luteimonas yindakuii]|uniref:Osmotically-inducible protein Y n=1 Tax=Luteimonas yindakuii TaxID=2565782 RepID=A0A4Z1RLG6_9GAMM|nr:BON domain-containing protein [Luteimonas yindakuii]TKS54939.1 BON domain-containing protein [Luteimonas yindakuii]